MPVYRPKDLSLGVDGHPIDLHASRDASFEINKSLSDPVKFQSFASDPQSFLESHNVKVDAALADQIKARLTGVNSLDDLSKLAGPGDAIDVRATVWAIAKGSFSFASSKIAAAF